MKTLLNLLRSISAVVVGYLVMAALITLVQEVWFGGIINCKKSRQDPCFGHVSSYCG